MYSSTVVKRQRVKRVSGTDTDTGMGRDCTGRVDSGRSSLLSTVSHVGHFRGVEKTYHLQ